MYKLDSARVIQHGDAQKVQTEVCRRLQVNQKRSSSKVVETLVQQFGLDANTETALRMTDSFTLRDILAQQTMTAGKDRNELVMCAVGALDPDAAYLAAASLPRNNIDAPTEASPGAHDANGMYARWYCGRKDDRGHEFYEFVFHTDGQLCYAYKPIHHDAEIVRKHIQLGGQIIERFKNIIFDGDILKEDDSHWPAPDRYGRQELDIEYGKDLYSFTSSKLGSWCETQVGKDPAGLGKFYNVVQGLERFARNLFATPLETFRQSEAQAKKAARSAGNLQQMKRCAAVIADAKGIIDNLPPGSDRANAEKKLKCADDLITGAATALDDLHVESGERERRRELLKAIETIGESIRKRRRVSLPLPVITHPRKSQPQRAIQAGTPMKEEVRDAINSGQGANAHTLPFVTNSTGEVGPKSARPPEHLVRNADADVAIHEPVICRRWERNGVCNNRFRCKFKHVRQGKHTPTKNYP